MNNIYTLILFINIALSLQGVPGHDGLAGFAGPRGDRGSPGDHGLPGTPGASGFMVGRRRINNSVHSCEYSWQASA